MPLLSLLQQFNPEKLWRAVFTKEAAAHGVGQHGVGVICWQYGAGMLLFMLLLSALLLPVFVAVHVVAIRPVAFSIVAQLSRRSQRVIRARCITLAGSLLRRSSCSKKSVDFLCCAALHAARKVWDFLCQQGMAGRGGLDVHCI
eukprot:351566-Chlamydomonas_euryale.AAC.2